MTWGFPGPQERTLVLGPQERVLLEVSHDKRAPCVASAVLLGGFVTLALWETWQGLPFSAWWALGPLAGGVGLGALAFSWRSFVTTDRVVAWSCLGVRDVRFADVRSCGWKGRTLSLEPTSGGRPVRVRFVRDRATVDARLKEAGLKPVSRG